MQPREVLGYVSPDAVSVSIWARFHPVGPGWVADPSFGIVEDWWNRADNESIRALIKEFADSRNAHDGFAAAALYSEDGEWVAAHGAAVRGRAALAEMWSRVPGQVERTIRSVAFPAKTAAIVRVATRYSEPVALGQETFVLIKDNGKWSIRVHQTQN
jgi:uncharacterized protein (TIGR02246 family)